MSLAAEALDPAAAVARLASTAEGVLFFGVRHHSPACSHAMRAVLGAFAPTRVMIELPSDYARWVEWLAHPDLRAPVALAGVREGSGSLSFYPFADFSPELVAMRWARAAGVAIELVDLPLGRMEASRDVSEDADEDGDEERARATLPGLLSAFDTPDGDHLWDHVVEARAPGAAPERIRRAGLAVGWALRAAEATDRAVSTFDQRREAWMRARIAAARAEGTRCAVIVGAFHVPALVDPPMFYREPASSAHGDDAPYVTSLIPYAFDLLDARSGYPAGIRDPAWQQRIVTALAEGPTSVEAHAAEAVVQICRLVRRRGHVAGVPDANEAVRVARDLAHLRDLAAPSRRELLEGIQTALGRGELFGRVRILARSCDGVLVVRTRGKLAPGTPRSGLGPHVEALLSELRLPGPESVSQDPTTMRLDPLRSELDRRRHVTLTRLATCGVPYGRALEGEAAGGTETLTRTWQIVWQPATEAMIELAGLRGVTLAQASEGALRGERDRLAREERLTASVRLALLRAAAECGLGALTAEHLRDVVGPFLDEAGLAEIVDAIALVERIRRGHVPGLPVAHEAAKDVPPFAIPGDVDPSPLVAAGVRALEGLAGSERIEDARAMLELVRLFESAPELGGSRLGWTVDRLAHEGAPVISGAAHALRVVMQRSSGEALGEIMGGWLDAAVDASSRRALASRIAGVLTVSAPLLEAHPDAIESFLARVEALDDRAFLARVSALRKGFHTLSTAARGRMLGVLAERLGSLDPSGRGLDVTVSEDPGRIAAYARADQAGKEAIAEWPATTTIDGR